MNLSENLIQNGWKKEARISFSEEVAKQASECYTYINANNTQIALLFYADKSTVKIRLGGTRGIEFNYFEIKLSNNEVEIATAINAIKGEADISNYFSFYFALQGVSDTVSILAWEQWEKNYR